MPGTVLLIAFHYPPCGVSSGLQRTLAFSRYLSEFGWRPVVLTVRPGAFERTSPHQLSDIPATVPVVRSAALDAARHLALRGRYWSRLGVPDRWRSWRWSAVPQGLHLCRKHRVDVIWSTYPIATAHRIGATLQRFTGLPWVADFRDPMVEYTAETAQWAPANPALRRARLRIERAAAGRAARLVFCTGAAARIVSDRYERVSPERLRIIPNGYEETAFREAEGLAMRLRTSGRRVLLHSGTVYASPDRDPSALFRALKLLEGDNEVTAGSFELRLRNPSNEDYLRSLAAREGVTDLVSILPPLPYKEALAEMMTVDGLLLLQGITSNPAVPAKLYEYLRARRPILGLVHPEGESARTLEAAGVRSVASMTDPAQIAQLLREWTSDPDFSARSVATEDSVAPFSRRALTQELARLLDEVCAGPRNADRRD